MAKVSIVMATEGEDQDHDYWIVAAYSDKTLAEEHVNKATSWMEKAAKTAKADLRANPNGSHWYCGPYDQTTISAEDLLQNRREYSVIEVDLRDGLPEHSDPESLYE